MTADATSTVATALAQAASAAGLAPSACDTRPWRRVVRSDRFDLRAEPDRRLPATDPAATRGGLVDLRERAAQPGGDFEVRTVQPHGTELYWAVPLRD